MFSSPPRTQGTPRSTRLALGVLCVLGGCELLVPTHAHEFSQTESTIEVDGTAARARIGINLLEIDGVDTNGDMQVTYEELDRAIERVFETIKQHYTLGAPGPPLRIAAEKPELLDGHVLMIDLVHTFPTAVRTLQVTSTFDTLLGPTHQHYATAIVDGERIRSVLRASNRTMTLEFQRVTLARLLTVLGAGAGLLLLAAYRLKSNRQRLKK
jgi:hypothetical protein